MLSPGIGQPQRGYPRTPDVHAPESRREGVWTQWRLPLAEGELVDARITELQ